jgi:hypothetical protein
MTFAGVSDELLPFADAVWEALPVDSQWEHPQDILNDVCSWLARAEPGVEPLAAAELAFLRSLELDSPEHGRVECPSSDPSRQDWLWNVAAWAERAESVFGLAATLRHHRHLVPRREQRISLDAVLALTTPPNPFVFKGYQLRYDWEPAHGIWVGHLDAGPGAIQLQGPSKDDLQQTFRRWVDEYLASTTQPDDLTRRRSARTSLDGDPEPA